MPKRPQVRCTECGSLERTRAVALHIQAMPELKPGTRILHFAPERGLSSLLRAIGGPHYRAVDIDPDRYPGLGVERFDLCRDIFDLGEDRYGLIVHNHVIEHIECNYSVALILLAKALTATGTMLFTVPILPGHFSDELIDAPLHEKVERFGPALHVRRFGTGSLQQTLGMIFHIPDRYDLPARFDEEVLRNANIPGHHWRSFTGASVFRVRRGDLRV
jgi:hypothetical protein